MRAKDPKQAVINKLISANPQAKREEMGILAKPDSIIFLKSKDYERTYAYVVRYTSTTNQQWYDTSFVIENEDGSFTPRYGALCRAEDCFSTSKENQMIYQPWLRISGGGGGTIIRKAVQDNLTKGTIVQEKTVEGVTTRTVKISSSSIYQPAQDISGYRFWVGYLTANNHTVASVRIILSTGPGEEDEVQNNTVLFLGKYSSLVAFEFYDPSHTLIATQSWDV